MKNKKINKYPKIIRILFSNYQAIALVLILVCFVFLRVYDFENKNTFGWDQVDNAWAAKSIIDDGVLPLVGMQAKLNSGIYIGPLYYYYVAPFYALTDLDPLASVIIALITSLLTFLVLYLCIKNLFSIPVALTAVFIYTFSVYAIQFDRVQWPVGFLPALSLFVFYFLYKSIAESPKFLPLVAVGIGILINLHFTAIFFPVFVLLSLPFLERSYRTLNYILLSFLIILVFLIPNIVHELLNNNSVSSNGVNYFTEYTHGLHGRRVLQVAQDAFIQYESVFFFPFLKYMKFIILPIFFIMYLYKKISKNKIALCYLTGIWFVVPWIVFSLYKGEITNYYFALTLPIVIFTLAYVLYRLAVFNRIIAIVIIVLVGIYCYSNVNKFIKIDRQGIRHHEEYVKEKILKGRKIDFKQGDPKSYIYYIRKERSGE